MSSKSETTGMRASFALLDAVGQATVVTDADVRVIFANHLASALLGWDSAVVGRTLDEALALAGPDSIERTLRQALTGVGWEGVVTARRAGGDPLPLRLRSTPVPADDGLIRTVVTVLTDLTAADEAELELRRLAAIVSSSTDAILSKTTDGIILTWNAAAERLYGFSEEEAIGQHVSLIVPAERRDELREIMSKIEVGSVVESLETLRRHRSGSLVEVVLSVWPLLDRYGRIVGATSVAHDLTERRRTAREREEAEVRFESAFRRSPVGMVIADLDGRATAVNPAICRMLARTPDELLGREWLGFLHPDDALLGRFVVSAHNDGDESYTCERRYLKPDGSMVFLQVDSNVVRNAAGEPVYLMNQFQDVTSRRAMEVELQHRALHDELTGLANRALLKDRLDHALAAGGRDAQVTGVAFIDLDRFKQVNDALGHSVGDRVLKEVARRLLAGVRPGDTVGRFGGDEFVIVAKDVTVDEMKTLAGRVAEQMTEPVLVTSSEVGLGVSIGLTVSRVGSTSAALLSEADAAMYRAKELGRGRTVVFDDSLRVRAAESLRGERLLRRAVTHHEVVPHYQPIIDLRTGLAVGVEALARWQIGDGRIVEPSGFIPLAESTGLIVPIGEAMLSSSAADVAEWNVGGGRPLWVSVNLSTRQIADVNLPRFVDGALRDSGLSPHLLHLEITETSIMQDLGQSIAALNQLKDMGVGLSVDDFGTGYSSLAYLQQLPVDMLKIDRSFVRGVGTAPDQTAIVEAIISLSRAMGMACVAEGVETADQMQSLVGLGCEMAQGFLWSVPLAPLAAAEWLRSR